MFKVITCIAAEDMASKVIQGLNEHFGIQSSVYHFARGFGRSHVAASRGMGQQTEKATIKVLVESKRVDEVFAYIFKTANLNQPHGGIIYTNAVMKVATSPNIVDTNMQQATHALE